MASIRVGISGWSYPSWRGQFYPRDVAAHDELAYAAQRFNSIEINASFYRLQRPETYRSWAEQTPPDFVFAVKASRYITHMHRLDSAVGVANFLASGVLALDAKLGPMLWQLPSSMRYDEAVLRRFVSSLPRTTLEAVAQAAGHDDRLGDRSWLVIDETRPLRHAIEVRHDSFAASSFAELAEEFNVAVVEADNPGLFPQFHLQTADFVYVRLHGSQQLYASRYADDELQTLSERIATWTAEGKDVYVYFDNDSAVHAPFDAMRLQRMVNATVSS